MLWDWQADDQLGDAHLHGGTGDVCLTMRDRDGDVTCMRLTWGEARALGMALVNGTAPWAGR